MTSDIDLDRDFDRLDETAQAQSDDQSARHAAPVSGCLATTTRGSRFRCRREPTFASPRRRLHPTSRVTGLVNVHTSGGSLDIETIEGPVDGSTSGGSIRMRDIRGNVDASTSGGSIMIADVRGNLRASTSGGGINIEEVAGDLRASTSGGSVDIRDAGGRVDASSSAAASPSGSRPATPAWCAVGPGGSVRAEIDPTRKGSIDATASGGSVSSDVPVTVQGKIERGRCAAT